MKRQPWPAALPAAALLLVQHAEVA